MQLSTLHSAFSGDRSQPANDRTMCSSGRWSGPNLRMLILPTLNDPCHDGVNSSQRVTIQGITMQINEIIQEALRLPASARFEIVDQLMQSLDKPDPEIERMWGEEAVRRLAALDAGRGQTYAADEVFGQD